MIRIGPDSPKVINTCYSPARRNGSRQACEDPDPNHCEPQTLGWEHWQGDSLALWTWRMKCGRPEVVIAFLLQVGKPAPVKSQFTEKEGAEKSINKPKTLMKSIWNSFYLWRFLVTRENKFLLPFGPVWVGNTICSEEPWLIPMIINQNYMFKGLLSF